MKTSLLVFDFDGTIADTLDSHLRILNHLSTEFRFRRITPHEVESLRDKSYQEILRCLQIPLIKVPLLVARVRRELRKEISVIEPVQGIREVLLSLKSWDYTLGILTSNSTENVKHFLKNHQLEVFDFVSAYSHLWGKKKRLHTLIKKNGVPLHDVFYIGDETRDIEAAKKAGIRSIAVTWGYNSQKALAAYGPEYLIHHPNQLLHICKISPLAM